MKITGSIMMNKYLGKSQYDHVYIRELRGGQIVYVVQFSGSKTLPRFVKLCGNEREAAIEVDKYLIEHNQEPINILKRK